MEQFVSYFHNHYGVRHLEEITTAKAVNDKARLHSTLNAAHFMIIDSDITKGPDGRAMCAHWPLTESDLSFDELLTSMTRTRQGLKLDFKDSDIVIECLIKLGRMELSQPVILNADILSLEGSPAPDFSGRTFLDAYQTYYPNSLLSVGWRTTDEPHHPYTSKDVADMLQLVKNARPLTFPIRASLLPASWPQLRALVHEDDRTLTIWNSTPISRELRQWLIEYIPADKAFYEL
ncbi:MAG TPA: DUF2181 domain-containing protein [Candidatus Limnocylindrales bacterium]|nr:DUF2181 domain-containing protein [Candidatus Limnocylindrales bacterium]